MAGEFLRALFSQIGTEAPKVAQNYYNNIANQQSLQQKQREEAMKAEQERTQKLMNLRQQLLATSKLPVTGTPQEQMSFIQEGQGNIGYGQVQNNLLPSKVIFYDAEGNFTDSGKTIMANANGADILKPLYSTVNTPTDVYGFNKYGETSQLEKLGTVPKSSKIVFPAQTPEEQANRMAIQKTATDTASTMNKLKTVADTMAVIEQWTNTLPGGTGLGGRVKGAVAGVEGFLQTNPVVAGYQATKDGLAVQLSRGLGEVGTMTDQDILRVKKFIPDITDNIETRQQKIQNLKDMVNMKVALATGRQDILLGKTQKTFTPVVNTQQPTRKLQRQYTVGEILDTPKGKVRVKGFYPDGEADVELLQ